MLLFLLAAGEVRFEGAGRETDGGSIFRRRPLDFTWNV